MEKHTAYNLSCVVRNIANKWNSRSTIIDPLIVDQTLCKIFTEKVKHEPTEAEISAALIGISDCFKTSKIDEVLQLINWTGIQEMFYEFYENLLVQSTKGNNVPFLNIYYELWMQDAAKIYAAFCYAAIQIVNFLNGEKEFQQCNNFSS